MAEAYELTVAPHNYYSHLADLHSIHLCATLPNVRIMEIDIDDVPWKTDLVTQPADDRGRPIPCRPHPAGARISTRTSCGHTLFRRPTTRKSADEGRLSRRRGVAALALAAWLLAARRLGLRSAISCTVNMNSDSFDRPKSMSRQVRRSCWNNPDADTHTVTADDGVTFDSGDVVNGGQFTLNSTRRARIRTFASTTVVPAGRYVGSDRRRRLVA